MSYQGTQVYAASELGTRIQPWWNVRPITPTGEGQELTRYPRRFARPVGGGSERRPYPTLFGRRIGSAGPEGLVQPLGSIADEWRAMAMWKKVALGGLLVAAASLAALKPLTKNPGRKLVGMSPSGERLMSELNPEDVRYEHIYAVKSGKSRYVGQVLDTGGAYFAVSPGGEQRYSHTKKEAAEALVQR